MPKKPMTTKEATEAFQCKECREGGDCRWDCVESSTYSDRCPNCGERVWFQGSMVGRWRDLLYVCPYCGVQK